MAVYYGLIAILMLVKYFICKVHCNQKDGKRLFLIISFLLLFFLAGFRDYSVGTDTLQFVEAYSIYAQYGFEVVSFDQIYEPGYMFFMWFMTRLTGNPRFLILITAIITNFSVIHFIGRYSRDYFLSVMIYILSCEFLVSMCLLRQFMAISIVLLGFDFLLKKKYGRFALVVLAASMFHYFSAVLIILIPIYEIKRIPLVAKSILFLIFTIIYVFLPQITLFLINHLSNYSDYLLYLENLGELQGQFRLPSMLPVWLALMLPLGLNYRAWSTNQNLLVSHRVNWRFLRLLYVFMLGLILLAGRMGIFTRLYYYFMIFLVLLPNIQDLNNENRWNLYIILVLLLIFTTALITGRGTYGAERYRFM